MKKDKEKILIKATKNNVAGTIDDTHEFGPDQELFSLK